MKKFTLLFIGIAILSSILKAQDKTFHKGLIVVNLGIDVSGYKTNIQDAYNNKVWNGGSFSTIRIQKNSTDGSGAAIYPLTIEYGLKNWLGVAARVAYSSS